MVEVTGDLWSYPADLHCITTNGQTTAGGQAVMGAGCALEARDRFPGIAGMLGHLLWKYGNRVHYLGHWAPFSPASSKPGWYLASFPTKHQPWQLADLDLIGVSAQQLVALIAEWPAHPPQEIVLPRPGCGKGGLEWRVVKPVLARILDDRFHVIDFKS